MKTAKSHKRGTPAETKRPRRDKADANRRPAHPGSRILPEPVDTQTDKRTDEQLIDCRLSRGGPKPVSRCCWSGAMSGNYSTFLVRFMGDRAAAEDVFQETFLQIHQSAETFRHPAAVPSVAVYDRCQQGPRSDSIQRPAADQSAAWLPSDPGAGDGGEFIDLMQSADESPTPSAPMEQQELAGRRCRRRFRRCRTTFAKFYCSRIFINFHTNKSATSSIYLWEP